MTDRRIGIITTSGNLFNSGMAQNAYFIYDVLTKCGFVCDLLCFDEKFTRLGYNNTPIKTIYDNDLRFDITEYKLIITVASGICKEMYAICKIHNIRIVAFLCGAVFHMNNAAFITENSITSIVTKSTPCDELWTIASYAYMKTYLEVLRGAPARLVPHLWSPCLIDYAAKSVFQRNPNDLIYKPENHTQKKATILIMEPSIEYVKTSLLPIMAVEKLYQQYPDLIDEVLVFSFPTKSKAASAIINSLSIRPKLRIFERIHIVDIMTTYNKKPTMPIFLSWQQHNEWNYTYYEMMYYGYPFVHNSSMMKEFGYPYDELNIDKCVTQLRIALETHNTLHESHMKNGRQYLESIDPAKPIAQRAWKDLVTDASG
jgi:hypothetical protein